MRTFVQLALVAWTLALMPVAARAQDAVPPESVAPEQTPPAAPAQPPAPPAQDQATAASPDANGQWVYTQQYGWVWMPYGDAYTYAPSEGEGQPYPYQAKCAGPYTPKYGQGPTPQTQGATTQVQPP